MPGRWCRTSAAAWRRRWRISTAPPSCQACTPRHQPRPPDSQLTMKEETMGSSEPAYERLGAKVLSLPDVIAQSVGFMGPVFASAFVIPHVVGVISASGKGGGVASPLSVLLAAVGVLALGWIVSSYAREIH